MKFFTEFFFIYTNKMRGCPIKKSKLHFSESP